MSLHKSEVVTENDNFSFGGGVGNKLSRCKSEVITKHNHFSLGGGGQRCVKQLCKSEVLIGNGNF